MYIFDHLKNKFILLLPLIFLLLLVVLSLFPAPYAVDPVQAQGPTPPAATDALITWSEPLPLTRPVNVVHQGISIYDLLAVDGRLYAGTNKGVFVSEDGGVSWDRQSEGLPDSDVRLLLAVAGGLLYARTFDGLFISQDGGQTWHEANEGLPASGVKSLLAVGEQLYAGTGEGLFARGNGEQSWRRVEQGLPVSDVWSLLEMKDWLYVRMADGVFVSQDGGERWRRTNEGPPAITADRLLEVNGWLYAGVFGGLFISEDGGKSWRGTGEGLPAASVWSLLAVAERLYAGTADGLFVSKDGGETWHMVNEELPAVNVNTLLAVEERLYAGTDGDLFVSEDGGESWRGTKGSMSTAVISSLLEMEERLYAGAFSGGVFVSEDGGNSWRLAGDGLPAASVWLLVEVAGQLYAGTDGGLFSSEDGGNSWHQVNEGLNTGILSLLEAEGQWYAGTAEGLFISGDGGSSWHRGAEGLPAVPIWTLLAVGGKLYAGTDVGVFVSEDGGETWHGVNEGLADSNVRALLEADGRLYVGTFRGLFVNENGAEGWRKVVEGLPAVPIWSLLAVGGRLYAGTDAGVFLSEDGGETWRSMNEGLTDSTVRTLLEMQGQLYAGTLGGGLFLSQDGGATWQPANGSITLHQALVETYPLLIQDLLPSDISGQVYLATQGGGVWIMTEAGQVITPTELPTPASQNVQILALDNNEQRYAGTFAGLYLSPGGQSPAWQSSSALELAGEIQAIAVDLPAIYVVIGGQQVIKSGDNGTTWQTLPAPIPGLRTNRLLLGANPGVLYAATDDGIYRSLDDGQGWQTTDLQAENVRELVRAGAGTFYAATSTGVHKTTDSWRNSERVFTGDFTSVAVDPLDTQLLYAAARDRLLFSRNGGDSSQEMRSPEGMTVDRLAVSSAAPNRLWAADSQQGRVILGMVNPNFNAPLFWLRLIAPWVGAVLVVGTVGLIGLSKYSGLPVRLLLRQKLMLLPVALRYDDYRQQWEHGSPLGQLLVLLVPPHTGMDMNQMAQRLAELNVPVEIDQLETELKAAGRSGLLRQQGGRYYPLNPPLACALQADEGVTARLALVEQIRHNHPLCTNARRFLEQAGFSLIPVAEPLLYRAEITSTGWQRLLPAKIYARFLPGETLDDRRVLVIRQQVQHVDSQASAVLAITDRRPTDSGWAQVGTLRIGGFTILPLDSALLNEGLTTGRERTLLRIEIEQRLGTDYNPYDVRDPVAGAFSFFGRDALVETLLRRLTEGRPVGVFGLRKLGKSSLLQALRDRALFPVAVVNLQTIGQSSSLIDLYRRILRYWAQEIRLKTDLEWTPPALTGDDPSSAFVSITLDLLDRLAAGQIGVRLGLLLDEIELIVPHPDGSGPDLVRYLTLLRTLRGLIDEDGRLSLVVASLNPVINRINAWNGEQNPTFNLFQEINLPPLTAEDCIHMVRNIGLQIGLVYSQTGLAAIANLSGGHPFLARQFCSLLYRRRNRQAGQIEAGEIPGGVHQFIYDEATVAHLDNGLWQEAGNLVIWGRLGAEMNQALLLELARADGPLSQTVLLTGPDSDARQTALINLERYHLIYQPEPGYYALQFGLLREWLRRRKLGLKAFDLE